MHNVLMERPLAGTVAIITGASSGIGEATALHLATRGASVSVVARRRERLERLADQLRASDSAALVLEADITDRAQAESVVQRTVEHYGRLDILINNAGLMLVGPVLGADMSGWDRMIATNLQALTYTTGAALPHLLAAAETEPRGVADIVNVSSRSGRVASAGSGVYSATKFAVNAFSESLRQEVTRRHVRVGVIQPGAVETELTSHNSAEIRRTVFDVFDAEHEKLVADDIASAIAYMVTQRRRVSIAELWVMPTDQA
jgi:NADP-dependent 3-hydroxy acid dehydrogenase YdfG